MNGLRKHGIYTQWNFTQPQRMKFCHSQVNGMELKNIILNEVRLRRPKITCSPSYVDHRPKTNGTILLGTGHTKGRPHTGGIGQGKEIKS
jgi:hypothetical protein